MSRTLLFNNIRKKGAAKEIVKLVEMYNGATTRVRTECGVSAEFPVTVGLHQGSALSPFVCVVVLDMMC